MKTSPRCAPCLLSRVFYEIELSTKDPKLQLKAVKAALKYLSEGLNENSVAVKLSTKVHRAVYEALGDSDPYKEKKRISNEVARKNVPLARRLINSTKDKQEAFRRAVLLSIIGNSFDFGVQGLVVEDANFESYMRGAFRQGLGVDDTPRMIKLLDRVVYLADNCGEIYFDALVVEQIKRINPESRITFVVRGEPILTDATLEDALEAGIDSKVDELLTTGSGAVGIDIETIPMELLNAMRKATLIISKGMANYESMTEYDFKPIAYLLRTKCIPIAESLGVGKGLNIAKLIE